MTVTLALTEKLWQELVALLELEVETGAVLLAGLARGSQLTLLGRQIFWVPEEAYERREAQRLTIRSHGYVPALKKAADSEALAVFFHTHPGHSPMPSQFDTEVDRQLADVFLLRTGQPYASLILGGSPQAPSFSGHVVEGGSQRIDRLRVVGDRLRLLAATDDSRRASDYSAFDRHIRAFGVAGQELFGRLHAGVVGAGGTGSAVCEQLLRLGIGALTVIDDDHISESNLTRIHESTKADVGQDKVSLIAARAKEIGLGTRVEAISARITELSVAQRLRDCDVVFGCTDDNRGRGILSRLAYCYLLPVIDVAFLVDTLDQTIRGLFGRVTIAAPGTPCLVCRGRIDQAQLAAEALPVEERQRLAAEGYVPGLGQADPAVGTFTTLTASFAVNELLARLFAYGGETPPSELLIRLHERDVRSLPGQSVKGHYCADKTFWGRGDREPFLDQVWL